MSKIGRPIRVHELIRAVSQRVGQRSIENIYCNEILKLRSRSVRLFGRKCRPEAIYTFLGYELKALGKRIICPDEVTLRYLKLFSELGMDQILVPLDPTQTSRFVEELERAQQALQQATLEYFPDDKKQQNAALRALYAWTRRRLQTRKERGEG